MRLAARPREVRDRFAEARRETARGEELHAQGQYPPALELFRKTVVILREILGEGHPETAYCYADLGITLSAQGKHAEAESTFRRAARPST